MTRILIADDHGLYRKGLRCVLDLAFPGADIVESDGFDGAMERLEDSGAFDVALLDLNMPGLVFPDSLREVRACYPRIRFAILSASDTRADMLASLAAAPTGSSPSCRPTTRSSRRSRISWAARFTSRP